MSALQNRSVSLAVKQLAWCIARRHARICVLTRIQLDEFVILNEFISQTNLGFTALPEVVRHYFPFDFLLESIMNPVSLGLIRCCWE